MFPTLKQSPSWRCSVKKAFLQLHISILLAGWTGVFGKLMMLSPGLIVFWRIVIAGGCLWLWAWLTKRLEKVTPRDRIAIMGVGALLTVQWTLFYASIKASNVSIGVVAFSSIGFFTALIEPLMNRARISLHEVLFSLVTIFGISLIFHFDAQYRLGIALGLVGAAAAALLAVYFKRYRAKYSSVTVMSWQLLGGFAFSCVAIPVYVSLMPPEPFIPTWPDTLYLPIFAIFCTLFMYILQIQSLEHISAFTVNLSYNLEPIYSIILAMIIFGEARDLGPSFYAGIGLIALSVALQTSSVVRGRKRQKRIEARKAAESAKAGKTENS